MEENLRQKINRLGEMIKPSKTLNNNVMAGNLQGLWDIYDYKYHYYFSKEERQEAEQWLIKIREGYSDPEVKDAVSEQLTLAEKLSEEQKLLAKRNFKNAVGSVVGGLIVYGCMVGAFIGKPIMNSREEVRKYSKKIELCEERRAMLTELKENATEDFRKKIYQKREKEILEQTLKYNKEMEAARDSWKFWKK